MCPHRRINGAYFPFLSCRFWIIRCFENELIGLSEKIEKTEMDGAQNERSD